MLLKHDKIFHKFCEVKIVIEELGSKISKVYKTCITYMNVHETVLVHENEEHLIRGKCVKYSYFV
jgi:hypothetical protein